MATIDTVAEAGIEAPNATIPRINDGYCDGCGDLSSDIPSNTTALGYQFDGPCIR